MITKRFLLLSSFFVLIGSAESMGGQGGTGSGPPAREVLEQMLMSADLGVAGLFRDEQGNIKIGLNRSLDDQIVLKRETFSAQSLLVSSDDFDVLKTAEVRNIDAVSVGSSESSSRSYVIEDGDSVGDLILKDRREIARNSIK